MGKRATTSRSSTSAGKRTRFTADQRIIVLRGAERYLRQQYTREIVGVLNDRFGEIQQFYFEGGTAQPAEVLDELRSYGLLQQHKLVIVDDADQFITPGKDDDEGGGGKSKSNPRRALLERYAEQPVEDATLLLRTDTWRPGKLDKLIAKVGTIVKCDPVNEAASHEWCKRRCASEYDAELQPAAATLLIERIGTDLARLDMELMKLATAAEPNQPITRDLVVELVGMSKEDKAWIIQEAIVSGNPGRALTTLWELLEITRAAPEQISWSIIDLARKLYAASRMLRQGVPQSAISKRLRLFGESQRLVLGAASRLQPAEAAQLLHHVIEADRHRKQGRSDPVRSLEASAMVVADKTSKSR